MFKKFNLVLMIFSFHSILSGMQKELPSLKKIAAEAIVKTEQNITALQCPLELKEYLARVQCVKNLIKEGGNDLLKALFKAIEIKNVEVASDLLELGAPIDGKNSNGIVPLIFAARSGHAEIVTLLLEKGAQIDIGDKEKRTPLMYATMGGHTSIMKALLAKGAHVDIRSDFNGTALCQAAVHNKYEAVKVLLAAGAQVNKQNQYGQTAFYHAWRVGYRNIDELLQDYQYIQDEQGDTALMQAVVDGKTKIVKELLVKGAQLQNPTNKTVLMVAAARGHSEMVKELLAMNVPIDMRDAKGMTALMFAAKRGHANVVKELLACNAQVDLEDNSRTSCFFHAQVDSLWAPENFKHRKVLRLLEEYKRKLGQPTNINYGCDLENMDNDREMQEHLE